MSYYLGLLLCFALGYCLTELVKTLRHKNTVIVSVKHLDGSVTTVEIVKGRDPEVDALIEEARARKGGAV